MGWYHTEGFSFEDGFDPEAAAAAVAANQNKTCSLPNNRNNQKTSTPAPAPTPSPAAAPPAPPKESAVVKQAPETACPLPPESAAGGPPPAPPEGYDVIYHLCQKKLWEVAVEKQEPYFPPTFLKDGKFTRASLHKKDVINAANEYYQDIKGDWICLELNAKLLFGMGIPILAQVAPESAKKKHAPITCLQIFGGISTTIPGLVVQISKITRSKHDGKFLSIVDPPPSTNEGSGDSSSKKAAATSKKSRSKQERDAPETKEKKKGGFSLFGKKN